MLLFFSRVFCFARVLSLFDAVLFRFNTGCWLVLSFACAVSTHKRYNYHCRYPAYSHSVSLYTTLISLLFGGGGGDVVVVRKSYTSWLVCCCCYSLPISRAPWTKCLYVSLITKRASERTAYCYCSERRVVTEQSNAKAVNHPIHTCNFLAMMRVSFGCWSINAGTGLFATVLYWFIAQCLNNNDKNREKKL